MWCLSRRATADVRLESRLKRHLRTTEAETRRYRKPYRSAAWHRLRKQSPERRWRQFPATALAVVEKPVFEQVPANPV